MTLPILMLGLFCAPLNETGYGLPKPVTFSEHIAPIIFENCTSCHRPGEAAPFNLMSYEDTKKRARMIERVITNRFMPPWHATESDYDFRDERRLEDRDIALIQEWVQTGRELGDRDAIPPVPEFKDGWQLGKPDLVVTMKEAYEVPADGPDIYRNFVLPLELDEDKWVRAIELRPGSRATLHHTLYFLDNTGRARELDGQDGQPGFFGMNFVSGRRTGGDLAGWGQLGGWAVGATPQFLPEDLALPLPKGSDLVLQSHFHPSGKAEQEQTTVGFFFADEPPSRTMVNVQLPPFFGALSGIDIPAGENDYVVEDSFELPVDVEGVSIGGHAHYICTSMLMSATLPEGDEEILLHIDRWDFNWQDRYVYSQAVDLPAGTTLSVALTYDNSAENPFNPYDPPQRIRWGRESEDEMGSMTLAVVPALEEDLPMLRDSLREHVVRTASKGARRAGRGWGQRIERQLEQLDTNGDGRLDRDEIPRRSRWIVRMIDRNGDGILDEEEIRRARERVGGGEER